MTGHSDRLSVSCTDYRPPHTLAYLLYHMVNAHSTNRATGDLLASDAPHAHLLRPQRAAGGVLGTDWEHDVRVAKHSDLGDKQPRDS